MSLSMYLKLSLMVLALIPSAYADKIESLLVGLSAVDMAGNPHQFADAIGNKHSVYVIMASDCPISRRMTPRLKELADIASQHDIDFYGVFSDDWSTRDSILNYQREYDVDFPLLLDSQTAIADKLRSGVKPEAFVFNKQGELVYRGRIDNRFASIGRLRNTFDQHDLLNAILAVKEGALPEVEKTEPVGCVYKSWPEK
ncbi:thioredoxin family protein [Maricurvus nonylphenolicus]|uniref:redoxin domain-containing protein n=1 Tax=Maricurvus nonylphenolicus TaxID=1008307 RepID=UPI0036F2B595